MSRVSRFLFVRTQNHQPRIMFVDRVKIELHAGRGGDGCMSFRREMHVPRGGPDGGDGGDGASLILEARHGVNSLASFANRRFYRGEKGRHGMGAKCAGRSGRSETLLVPPGTLVIDAEHGFVIKELLTHGEQFVIARGGKGGAGNVHFKSSTNQAPRERKRGSEGESRTVILELKSIADVGLVGMPNAGKSTLLSRISSARPEIADYPFTTKHPNIGIVDVTIERAFVLADIPGLIEGASEGLGLGHEFLKHVERAGLLVHLIEPSPVDGTDPLENYKAIRRELCEYDESLGERDEVIVVTKSELENANEFRDLLAAETGKEVLMISAVTGSGLAEFSESIMARVEARRNDLRESGGQVPLLRQADEQVEQRKALRRKRLPPHLAGATAALSNQLQAKDLDDTTADDLVSQDGDDAGDAWTRAKRGSEDQNQNSGDTGRPEAQS